jgi:PKD repeat protein
MKTKHFFQTLALMTALTSAQLVQAQCQAGFTSTVNGAALAVTNTSTGGVMANYSWSFGDGTYDYAASPAAHTYQYAGTYNVCITLWDSVPNSCTSTFCDSIVIVNAPPPPPTPCSASFTYWNDTTLGNTVNFYNTSTPAPTTNWSWTFGDGNTSTQQNPAHQYAQPGMYVVCLSITDALGQNCTTCDSLYAGTSNCQASFTQSANPAGSVTFTNTSTGAGANAQYTWSFGDGNQGTGVNASHTYQYNGVYMVCLTLNDFMNNCYNTYCDSVVITGLSNPPCNAMFTAWPDSSNANAVYFYDQSSLNPIAWSWNFGDGNTSTLQYPTHAYAQAGTYSVCLTVVLADSSTCSYCTSVTTGNTFGCSTILNFVKDTLNPLHFWGYATVTGTAPFTYQWSFGDGNTSTQQYPSHTYAQAGTYLVCLTTIDANGCNSTSCDSVSKHEGLLNVQSITILAQGTLGVNEVNASIGSTYPNPFSTSAVISYTLMNDADVQLTVCDVTGRTVAGLVNENQSAGAHQTTWTPNDLPSGIYWVKMTAGDNTVTKKLVLIK